jgi:hypothetical protein
MFGFHIELPLTAKYDDGIKTIDVSTAARDRLNTDITVSMVLLKQMILIGLCVRFCLSGA